MRRWLFNILCLLSLIACTAVVVLWVRSYWRFDHWRTVTILYSFASDAPNKRSVPPKRRITSQIMHGRQIESSAGFFRVSWDSLHCDLTATEASLPADTPATIHRQQSWSTPKVRALSPRLDAFSFAGVAHYSAKRTNRPDPNWINTLNLRIVQIHYWLPTALLSVLPLCWFFLHIRARRAKCVGFCRICGYDLRATPGCCPECGRKSETPAAPVPTA